MKHITEMTFLDGYVMEPTVSNWAEAAAIICGHDFIQQMDEDSQATFHSFVRDVLRTVVASSKG